MYSRSVNKKWLIDNNEPPIPGNRIVLGVTLPAVSYQPVEFGASQVITAKASWLNEKNGTFFAAAISKLMHQFSYQNKPGLEIYKNLKITLPTKKNQINFDFMERFISELESERISDLEAYLSATGLKNYQLTFEEQKALDSYPSLQFEDFKLVDVFTVKNSDNIISRDIVENNGDIPYLCASRENNSVSSYISYDTKHLDKGNCVFIGGKTFVVTYQEADFYSNDSHNLILYLKDEEKRTRMNQLYLAACVNNSLKHKYSWGDSISNKKIQKDTISLPVKNSKPDLSTMEVLISAIQKLALKDVVLYVNKKSQVI
jgi:hypothetical protein